MANRTTPLGSIYNGWFYDAVTPAMKYYNRGTLVLTAAVNALTTAGALTVVGAATLATGKTEGDHEFSSTITAGADGVGTDSEQLASGGAGVAVDWTAAV